MTDTRWAVLAVVIFLLLAFYAFSEGRGGSPESYRETAGAATTTTVVPDDTTTTTEPE